MSELRSVATDKQLGFIDGLANRLKSYGLGDKAGLVFSLLARRSIDKQEASILIDWLMFSITEAKNKIYIEDIFNKS